MFFLCHVLPPPGNHNNYFCGESAVQTCANFFGTNLHILWMQFCLASNILSMRHNWYCIMHHKAALWGIIQSLGLVFPLSIFQLEKNVLYLVWISQLIINRKMQHLEMDDVCLAVFSLIVTGFPTVPTGTQETGKHLLTPHHLPQSKAIALLGIRHWLTKSTWFLFSGPGKRTSTNIPANQTALWNKKIKTSRSDGKQI